MPFCSTRYSRRLRSWPRSASKSQRPNRMPYYLWLASSHLPVTIGDMNPGMSGEQPKLPIPGVRYLIAIGSGKGGVGKTTVAVNTAVALSQLGFKVGLLDADVYGPNVPLMMGIRDQPGAIGDRIQPLKQYGLRLM